MSLLHRTLVLVGICLLPAVAIHFGHEWESRSAREAELRNEALQHVCLAAADLDRVVEGFHRFPSTLAHVPTVRAAPAPGCEALLQDMARQDPVILNIGISDTGGRTPCSALPVPPQLIPADGVHLAAIKNGSFTIGEYAIGRAIAVPAIYLALPLQGADGPTERAL